MLYNPKSPPPPIPHPGKCHFIPTELETLCAPELVWMLCWKKDKCLPVIKLICWSSHILVTVRTESCTRAAFYICVGPLSPYLSFENKFYQVHCGSSGAPIWEVPQFGMYVVGESFLGGSVMCSSQITFSRTIYAVSFQWCVMPRLAFFFYSDLSFHSFYSQFRILSCKK